MKEVWKDVVGYEGLYKVGNDGNVYSSITNIIMKKTIINTYYAINIKKNKKQKVVTIHRMVGLHFVPGKTIERRVINHKDGNKLNNHYSNLEWCTYSENMFHAYKLGLIKPSKGSNHCRSKLSELEVSEIRDRYYLYGEKMIDLSKDYPKISYRSICRIINHKQRV